MQNQTVTRGVKISFTTWPNPEIISLRGGDIPAAKEHSVSFSKPSGDRDKYATNFQRTLGVKLSELKDKEGNLFIRKIVFDRLGLTIKKFDHVEWDYVLPRVQEIIKVCILTEFDREVSFPPFLGKKTKQV